MSELEEIKELRKIIQEAWCVGESLWDYDDTFGAFLNRAANEIYSQGYRKIETEKLPVLRENDEKQN